MSKLLYDDGEGRTHEVSRLVWEQVISDVRDEVAKELGDPFPNVAEALERFRSRLAVIDQLLDAYKERFGDPYPER